MLSCNYTTSETTQHTNISATVRTTLREINLSLGARVILGELQYGAGKKGYVYYLIETLAKNIGISLSQCKRYLRELREKGYISAVSRPRRSNVWFINGPDTGSDMTHINYRTINKNNVKNVESANQLHPSPQSSEPECIPNQSKSNDNAISSYSKKTKDSKPKVYDTSLLREIIEVTGDKCSIRCWIKIVNSVPEMDIRQAISSLRIAMTEQVIIKPGAYLMAILKSENSNLFDNGSAQKNFHLISRSQQNQHSSTTPQENLARTKMEDHNKYLSEEENKKRLQELIRSLQ